MKIEDNSFIQEGSEQIEIEKSQVLNNIIHKEQLKYKSTNT